MPGPVERRQAFRYPIRLRAELEQGSGMTRDISTSGVFVETDHAFSIGNSIRLTLVLEPTFHGVPTHLHCQGKIVRVQQDEGKQGVGIAFTSYWFEPLGGGRGR